MKKIIITSPTNPKIKHINLLLNKAQTAFLTFMLLLSLSQQVQAQAGAALNFDGTNDNVDIGSQSSLSATTAFTVETWLKRTAGSYIYPVFFSKSATDWAANSINFGGWSSGAGIYARVAGASDAYGYNTGSMLPADTWTHVAVVYDGSGSNNAARLKIYINGAPISLTFVGTIPATTPTVTANTTLGVATGSSHYWKGAMDEVRVWSRALCQGEIQNNMNCELGGTQSFLQAYYKFNQGTGEGSNSSETTLTDASGNSNNGTLTNFALSGSTSNWVSPSGVTSGVSCSVYLAPEINLKGNTVSITSGTTATSTSNHTDFGNVAVNGSFARNFTIENAGTGLLNVSSITYNNTKFVVSNAPPSVSASGSQTFTVTFNPTATGVETAIITVNNDDCDEGAYTFTVTGTGTAVLPIELLNFKATPSVSSVKLDWQTANEVNNKGFQIERLNNLENKWEIISFVPAKGKTSTYVFEDYTPRNINYYRLRQIDNDGKETLSKVVSASLKDKSTFKVYPNPVFNHLTLDVSSSDATDYRIFNLLGKQVLYGKTVQQIDVSALPQGTYVIKVGTEQAKFVKQ